MLSITTEANCLYLKCQTEKVNTTNIVAEKVCVVAWRKSVHPQSGCFAFCVFRILILFIFSVFRFIKRIVHTAGM